MLQSLSGLLFGSSGGENATQGTPGDRKTEALPDPDAVASALSGRVVASSIGQLFRYSSERKAFEKRVASAGLYLVDTGSFAFQLVVYKGKACVLKQRVSAAMNMIPDRRSGRMIWNVEQNGSVQMLGFKFGSAAGMSKMARALAEALYEEGRRGAETPVSFSKGVKNEADKEWVYEAMGGSAAAMDESDDDEAEEDMDELEVLKERLYTTPMKKRAEAAAAAARNAGNSELEVGFKQDQSYVFNGSEMGVFASGGGAGGLKYRGKLAVRDTDGKEFTPQKALLQQGENEMVMMTPDHGFAVMDIERGKIVNEFKGNERIQAVRDLTQPTKFAQMTGSQLLAGISRNSYFVLDQRVDNTRASNIAISQDAKNSDLFKPFRGRGPKLSCVATSATGENGIGLWAIGSEKGEIRLGNAFNKQSKTLLPGLGDPIKAIDIASNGDWLVATCSKYLLVIPTVNPAGKTAFERRMTNADKPMPLKLQIHPEDVAKYGIKTIDFNKAHFDACEGKKESLIISSTGGFAVMWNFGLIRKYGKRARWEYCIRRIGGQIVANKFGFNKTEVVMATKDDVLVQAAKFTKKRRARPRG